MSPSDSVRPLDPLLRRQLAVDLAGCGFGAEPERAIDQDFVPSTATAKSTLVTLVPEDGAES